MENGPSRLHELAATGNLTQIEKAVSRDRSSLNSIDENGQTPLHVAVINRNKGAVLKLLEMGADPYIYDYYGNLPLNYTQDKIIRSFFRTKGIPEPATTPLHEAVQAGDIVTTQKILSDPSTLINAIDVNGYTPLHWACMFGHTEIVKLLIRSRANLNALDQSGYPPIDYTESFPTIRRLLLQNHAQNIDEFIHHDLCKTALHDAVKQTNLTQLKRLLKQDSSIINQTDRQGRSPLFFAVYLNDMKSVEALIKAGADINLANRQGNTPLVQAIQDSNEPMVRYLIEAGADINFCDEEWNTALHKACLANNELMVQILIEAGADLNLTNKLGNTPLVLAIQDGNEPMVRILLQAGADINLSNFDGVNPLHQAILMDNEPMVRLLMKYKPETNIGIQSNAVELAKKDNKYTPLARYLKKEIGLPSNWLNNLKKKFATFLKNEMEKAQQQNKKLLLVLGETHGDFKIGQIEKIMLQVASELGIKTQYIEVAKPEEMSFPVNLKAKDKYGITFEAVDTLPQGASIHDRNSVMAANIAAKRENGVLITGADHLHGLIGGDQQTKIDEKLFHVVPFNLTSIYPPTFDTPEEDFRNNHPSVFQIELTAECFSIAKPESKKLKRSDSTVNNEDTSDHANKRRKKPEV